MTTIILDQEDQRRLLRSLADFYESTHSPEAKRSLDYYTRLFERQSLLLFPTENDDVNFLIMELLPDEYLLSLCQVNRHSAHLCRDELFWRERIRRVYGVDLKGYLIRRNSKGAETYKQAYLSLARSDDYLLTALEKGYYPIIQEHASDITADLDLLSKNIRSAISSGYDDIFFLLLPVYLDEDIDEEVELPYLVRLAAIQDNWNIIDYLLLLLPEEDEDAYHIALNSAVQVFVKNENLSGLQRLHQNYIEADQYILSNLAKYPDLVTYYSHIFPDNYTPSVPSALVESLSVAEGNNNEKALDYLVRYLHNTKKGIDLLVRYNFPKTINKYLDIGNLGPKTMDRIIGKAFMLNRPKAAESIAKHGSKKGYISPETLLTRTKKANSGNYNGWSDDTIKLIIDKFLRKDYIFPTYFLDEVSKNLLYAVAKKVLKNKYKDLKGASRSDIIDAIEEKQKSSEKS